MSTQPLCIRVLGPVEIIRGDQVIRVGGTKPRVVLSLLALQVGRAVSVEALVGALWPNDVPGKAVGTLQAHISALRRALDEGGGPSCVVNRPPGYLLDLDAGAVDLAEFEELADRGRALAAAGRPAEASATLRRAEGLWRGQALADLASEHALIAPAAALDEARIVATEARIAADLQRGAHVEVVPELHALTAAHPLREDLWASLMLALYRSGRQADALAAYRQARTTLVDELGIEPGPALQALEGAILAQSPELDHQQPVLAYVTPYDLVDTSVAGGPGAAPPAFLVLADGERVALGGRCTIGRHPDCTVIVDDPKASRHHAAVRTVPGGHLLTDLESTNGTRVGGEPVRERALHPGDEIEIGGIVLRYELA